MKRTQIVGAALAIAVLIGMFFIPESIGLSRAGIHTLGVLIAIIITLVTEPLPIGITCMLGVALMVIFGAASTISNALSGYTNHILFFVLVSFGLSEFEDPLFTMGLVKGGFFLWIFMSESKLFLFSDALE